MEADEVGDWFRGSLGGNALFYSEDRLVGVVWAWPLSGVGTAWMLWEPSLINREVMDHMLGWVGESLNRMGVSGDVAIRAGLEGSYAHRTLRSLLPEPIREESWGTLMIYCGGQGFHPTPPRYSIRRAWPEDASDVAKLLNTAFSGYEWWRYLGSEEIAGRLRRDGVTSYVVVDESGGIVGYVDGESFEALDGGLTFYVGFLAVNPAHQGRGLGKALMERVLGSALRLRTSRILIDSAKGLEGFYEGLGFTPHQRWMIVRKPAWVSSPIHKE